MKEIQIKTKRYNPHTMLSITEARSYEGRGMMGGHLAVLLTTKETSLQAVPMPTLAKM